MRKMLFICLVIVVSFFSGYAFKSIFSHQKSEHQAYKKVTGIGGIFFKCKDPRKMKEWYDKNLGITSNSYGAVFQWYQGGDSTQKGFSTWCPFKETTKYFEPSQKEFMINYRVDNMDLLLADLRKNAVKILDTVESYDYGKFLHIIDEEGNKIELWEPNDKEYEALGRKLNSPTIK